MNIILKEGDGYDECIVNTDHIRYVFFTSDRKAQVRFEPNRWIDLSKQQYKQLCEAIEEENRTKKALMLSQIETMNSKNISI